MRRWYNIGLAVALLAAFRTPASADRMFTASLTGDQHAPPVTTAASGSAQMTLSGGTLSYQIWLSGLDLDGLQTPGTADDDVIGLHFHNGPPGVNGPIVFGIVGAPPAALPGPLGAGHDTNDRVIDPVTGTISGAWDPSDAPDLSAFLGSLLNGDLYLNVHTPAHPPGEIRGQVNPVPEPGTWALFLLGAAGVVAARRRNGQGQA